MRQTYDTIIKDCISGEIENRNTVFVFPTQICASMWCDKSLEFSGKTAVALERFIAWDDFKSSAIRSSCQNKTAVPSAMRSIFAENIIQKNAAQPFFKNIINVEFAKNAERFSTWIASLLPSLSLWKKKFEQSNAEADDEDSDFLELYQRYSDFLSENNLFDPAWETPPFYSDGKKYVIFFPEILMDFTEYKTILESSDDIALVSIPAELKTEVFPDGYFYTNSRIELKEVAHYVRNIHAEKKIRWDKIAVSVPNLDTYGPYLDREFELYQIPHVLKNGTPLSGSGVGRFFNQLKECKSENFSYRTVKNLLLNKELPWKEPGVNDMLILFGRENNCLCSYEYNGKNVDVWEEAFLHPLDFSAKERIEPFYSELKKCVSNIVNAKTFAEIRTFYFSFREKFFDFSSENFSEQNDNILSRCISELGSLIDLEEQFSESSVFEIASPYRFFCSYLDGKMYVPQNSERGVQILPYRTACCAPFDVHIVVDASQSSTSVVYTQLPFLSDDKRKKLGFSNDENVSQDFILLYKMSAQVEALFTCSEKTFDSYEFLNSYLSEKDCRPKKKCSGETFVKDDSYARERNSYLENDKTLFPEMIFSAEKIGFENWRKTEVPVELSKKLSAEKKENSLSEILEEKIIRNGKVLLSVSKLNLFYSCPRKFLFKQIYGVEQEGNAAELIDKFEIGNLNHKIMELFCAEIKQKNMTLQVADETNALPETHLQILKTAVDEAIENEEISHLGKSLLITSRTAIEKKITSAVLRFSKLFSGYSVLETETEYKYIPDGKKYEINLRIDCLLCSPDGECVLVDFKNTDSAFPKQCFYEPEKKSAPNFQLPVYKFAVEHCGKTQRTVSACLFFALEKSNTEKKILFSEIDEQKLKKKEDENALFALTQEKCFELIDECAEMILNHDFVPEKIGVEHTTCRSCMYKSMCRRTFAVGTKND